MRAALLVAGVLAILGVSPSRAQLLDNGDFEQFTTGWTTFSNPAGYAVIGTGTAFASTEISPPVIPRSGQYMARVGGFSYLTTAIGRNIALPNTRPLYIGLYAQTRTSNISECNGLWVGARIRVQIAGQIVYDEYLCHYNDALSWSHGFFDVSSVAGQTVDFVVQADAANTVWSYLYIDDVYLFSSVDAEVLGTVPEVFELDAAWPNPFQAETRIPVDLPAPATVRMTVFDALGRAVAPAVDEVLPAGRHHLTFDGTGLAPGVYVARVEAGGRVRSVRLVRSSGS